MNCDALPNEHMRKICKGEIPFGTPEQHDALMVRWFRDLAAETGVTIRPQVRARASRSGVGVGSVMARKIKWLTGITAENATCKCAILRDQMDMMGTDWCANNADLIIDKVLANARSREAQSTLQFLASKSIGSAIGGWAARKAVTAVLRSAIHEVDAANGMSQRVGIPPQPMPFHGEPNLTLLFHVYPTSREVIERHAAWLAPVRDRFHRKLLGVAVSDNTMTVSEVLEILGEDWEVSEVSNNPKLREVKTYKRMLAQLDYDDPDAVTFCAHGKGSQSHTRKNEPVNWWTEAMYRTVLHNIDGVLQHMREGYTVTGSFRRWGRHLGVRHRHHYSGTFYAFRNCLMKGKVSRLRSVWWGTESWPGDCVPFADSACLFGDNCGNMYHKENQPRQELEAWLSAKKTEPNGDTAHRS
jgi:hypothetical protein